jgi:hypothetical protein
MKKLIAAYLADASHQNARRLVNYVRKHPMAVVCLDHLEAGLLRFATELVEGR